MEEGSGGGMEEVEGEEGEHVSFLLIPTHIIVIPGTQSGGGERGRDGRGEGGGG